MNPLEAEAVFAEPWEAQAFAMAAKLVEAGHFTPAEWAQALGAELAAHPDESYYCNWLSALEKLAERKGLTSLHERLNRIEAWDRAAKATPHGQPIELNRS